MTDELLDDALGGKATLYRKIAEVMAAVDRLPKTGWNDFHKYHYVTEADLVEAVRGLLAERQVAILPSAHTVEWGGPKGTVTLFRGTFTFVDGETGASVSCKWAGTGDDPSDKGLYKAYTGALKYFLLKTFLIPTGDDPEADTGTDKRARGNAPTRVHAPATDKQKKLREKLIAEKRPTVAQWNLLLNAAGVTDRPADPGELKFFIEGLDSALTSALIEQLMALPKQEAAA